jgi:two-component system, response regulator PdtaR
MGNSCMTRVLLAEDEALIALPMQLLLEQAGYQVAGPVTTAADLLDSLEGLEANGELPDVLLVDISLRGTTDGIEAAHQINARYGNRIALIFLTGRSDEAMRERAQAASPAGYLVKPCSFDQVAEAISRALRRHPKAADA